MYRLGFFLRHLSSSSYSAPQCSFRPRYVFMAHFSSARLSVTIAAGCFLASFPSMKSLYSSRQTNCVAFFQGSEQITFKQVTNIWWDELFFNFHYSRQSIFYALNYQPPVKLTYEAIMISLCVKNTVLLPTSLMVPVNFVWWRLSPDLPQVDHQEDHWRLSNSWCLSVVAVADMVGYSRKL